MFFFLTYTYRSCVKKKKNIYMYVDIFWFSRTVVYKREHSFAINKRRKKIYSKYDAVCEYEKNIYYLYPIYLCLLKDDKFLFCSYIIYLKKNN